MGRRRKRSLRIGTASFIFIAAAAAVIATVLPAGAVHDANVIELDTGTAGADQADSNAANNNPSDWQRIFNASGVAQPSGFPAGTLPNTVFFRNDQGADATYHTSSDQDNMPINAGGGANVWGCKAVNNATDKNDILNAYALAARVQAGTGAPSADVGDLIVYAGAERYSNDGSAFWGIWFFQSKVGCTPPGKWTGQKTDGDILVVIDFDNGGANVHLNAVRWHPCNTAGCDPTNDDGFFTAAGAGGDCGAAGAADDLCASVNRATLTTTWPTQAKNLAANTLGVSEFFETGLNLTDLFAGGNPASEPCFGSVSIETRTAPQLTSADVKDYVLGDFSTCGSVRARKYLDVNGNGAQDTGESLLDGWTMNLYRDNDNSDTFNAGDTLVESKVTGTAGTGEASFGGVRAGEYVVCEQLLAGTPAWVNSDPGGGSLCKAVTVSGTGEQLVKFGNGAPAIDVTKTCTANVFVGDTINYTITVTNTGNTNLQNVDVTDSLLGSINLNGTLTPGQSVQYTPTRAATSADVGTVNNTVTASGDYGTGATPVSTVTDTASCASQVWEISVSKTATPSWQRTFNWTISKSVIPTAAEIFENDQQDLAYTITATKGVSSDLFGVSGSITVSNPAPIPINITSVTDVADGVTGTVTCPGTAPYTIPAASGGTNGTLVCSYSVSNLPDGTGTNTATANKANGTSKSGTQNYTQPANPTGTVNDSASVNDVATVPAGLVVDSCTGDCTWPQTISSSTTFNYTKTVHSTTAGVYVLDNTATVTFGSSSQNASASSTITVRPITVTKTATPTWVRTFDWTVTKSVSPDTEVTITPGSSAVFNYTITATRTETSNAFGVSGNITVTNPNTTKAAIMTALTDVADGVNATVTCPSAFPITIPAGGNVVCSYSASGLPDADGTNTATATNQNRHFGSNGSSLGTIGTGTTYQGSQTYSLSSPTSQVDDTATISEPGIVCPTGFTCTPDYTGADGAPPWHVTGSDTITFPVTITAGSTVGCDQHLQAPNTVTLTEDDSGATHQAGATVLIYTGACPGFGCTPGYWKNHTERWDQDSDPVVQAINAAIAAKGPPYTQNPAISGLRTELFRDIFGLTPLQMTLVGLNQNLTMEQAINLGGGGFQKLARHGVAGLLSSAANIGYVFSTDQVLTMVHNAVVSRQAEPTATQLAAENERQCPLN